MSTLIIVALWLLAIVLWISGRHWRRRAEAAEQEAKTYLAALPWPETAVAALDILRETDYASPTLTDHVTGVKVTGPNLVEVATRLAVLRKACTLVEL